MGLKRWKPAIAVLNDEGGEPLEPKVQRQVLFRQTSGLVPVTGGLKRPDSFGQSSPASPCCVLPSAEEKLDADRLVGAPHSLGCWAPPPLMNNWLGRFPAGRNAQLGRSHVAVTRAAMFDRRPGIRRRPPFGMTMPSKTTVSPASNWPH